MNNIINKTLLTIVTSAALSSMTYADVGTAKANLTKTYPNTSFDSVTPTPIAGVYQVIMGKNIAFTDEEGKFFIFGHLFDMQRQQDLTASVKETLNKIDFSTLPLKNALKIVKGNGGKGVREFVLFTDPDCPYCQRVEETLEGMTDYTVYVFLYPIASLHPDAAQKAEAVWCSKNQGQAWHDLMLSGKKPAVASCKNPVANNVKLASKLGISGTPTMVHKTGKKLSGAVPRATLENWLDGK